MYRQVLLIHRASTFAAPYLDLTIYFLVLPRVRVRLTTRLSLSTWYTAPPSGSFLEDTVIKPKIEEELFKNK